MPMTSCKCSVNNYYNLKHINIWTVMGSFPYVILFMLLWLYACCYLAQRWQDNLLLIRVEMGVVIE